MPQPLLLDIPVSCRAPFAQPKQLRFNAPSCSSSASVSPPRSTKQAAAAATVMSANYTTPTTLSEVRDYVLTESNAAAPSPHTLLLNVHHSNLKQTRLAELRFDRNSPVAAVKQRLYLHTGTQPSAMQLFLCDPAANIKRKLLADQLSLAEVGAVSGDSLLIVDHDPFSVSAHGALEDLSLAPKYEMSDAVYDAKPNTYRRFKQQMRNKHPQWSMTTELRKKQPQLACDYAQESPPIRVDDRVQVSPGGKRGSVKFVGTQLTDLPEGWWIGIVYDEPVGKNDGVVKGVRYFDAQPNFGALVRPSCVEVGHFPPLDDFSDREHGSEDEI
ncbi:Tubulin-folding cofactor B [Gracilariopsis chorda]|uniref:Tubulin-folding cofactor B n=1 Tax=Gracilariopsis chorda TaxID=448386 RepID=A0A2V3IM90_9FLOR|nr:Tubulin-folding cofactor B [Gracilariopsis chorda]|eukprot:PXF43169.1 Tubulin-folding cofactor B [Gracilariopsis chorda]